MSLHGTQSPPPDKKKKGFGGFKPSGSSSASRSATGSSYSPPSGAAYSPPAAEPKSSSPFGGMFGGGGGGGGFGNIFGGEPTGPGMTENWSDGTRLAVAIGACVLIVGAFGALLYGILQGGAKVQLNHKVGTTASLTKFVPPTTASGALTDMPITFTDGTTADLLYDPSLDLAAKGINLSDSGSLNNFVRLGGQFEIDHGGASFAATESPTPPPSRFPAPQNSSVPLLPAVASTPSNGNFLDFVFGPWRVGVWEGTGTDQMSPADDQTWAQSLTATVTASGFLVLSATPPVKLTPYGASDGPAIIIGDPYSTGIILTPVSCAPPPSNERGVTANSKGVNVKIIEAAPGHYEGNLCIQGAKMNADIYGSQQFVQSAVDSLDIQNLHPGPVRAP